MTHNTQYLLLLALLQSISCAVYTASFDQTTIYQPTTQDVDQLLLYAAQLASSTLLEHRIRSGAAINATDIQKKTALMYAAEHNKVSNITILLSHGAAISAIDHKGWTALQYAKHNNNHAAVAVLRQAMARAYPEMINDTDEDMLQDQSPQSRPHPITSCSKTLDLLASVATQQSINSDHPTIAAQEGKPSDIASTGPTDSSTQKKHPCPQCPKQYSSKKSLQQHMKLHTGNVRYLCKTCGKNFIYKSKLIEHERTHIDEKPYSCPWERCGKAFAKKGALTRHQQVHTQNKPHKCAWVHCGKTFSRKDNLQRHVLSLHTKANRSHTCSWQNCGKQFVQKSALTRHQKTHEKNIGSSSKQDPRMPTSPEEPLPE